MGSLAYLRTLCGAREAQDWRERMATLLESEGRSPQRRERLASAYNRGYRAYSATHRTCSDGTQEASARLAQEGEKLAKEIGGLKGRLNNPSFVASAPEEVVDEARANLEAREDEAAKIAAALTRLAEIG